MTLPTDDPRLPAAADLVRRSGARSLQIRYSDDEQPVVWLAVAEYGVDPAGRPLARGGRRTFEAAGGMTPRDAMMRLLDAVVDGAECAHCHRPTGVTDEWRGDMPLAEVLCWYRFDPETQTFRRGCEGDA